MGHVVKAFLVVTADIGATFVPFFPGDFDPLAKPLSVMALIFGCVGLLLVPIGALWLWVCARRATIAPPRWLVWVTLGTSALIALVMILVALALARMLFALGTATVAGWLLLRLSRRLRAATRTGPRMAPVIVMFAPMMVLSVQLALIEPVTTFGRNRVIANSATLINELEQHRIRHGSYPESLLAVWGDYKPAIMGVERYHYERSGAAYNVVFVEPSLVFGDERYVVYNPRDEQQMMSHAQDRVLLAGAELEAQRGYHTVQKLPQPHWKVFLFD